MKRRHTALRTVMLLGALFNLPERAFAWTPGQQTHTPVILISIDTLRADHLSAYGYRKIHTPGIDAFAQNGTVYTGISTQVPLTLPSHTSMFTSTYPMESRIEENAEHVPPGTATLASVLRSNGYRTAAFIGSVFLERQMGLDAGFDVYDSPFNFEAFSPISGEMFFGGLPQPRYSVHDRRPAALVLHAARAWLTSHREEPVFTFVHLFDMHQPYTVKPDAARQAGISPYDLQLKEVDRLLGRFREMLVETGWWDRALVVVVADHGESLGDHGEANHGYFIYQSTLWVPLLIHWPTGSPTPATESNQAAGLIDVAPTILDFLHIAAPQSFEGHSLLGQKQPTRSKGVYSESLHAHDSFGWAPLRSIRVGHFKYIDAPKPELYDLEEDPHEQTNIVSKKAAVATELRNQLHELVARYTPKGPAPVHANSSDARVLLGSLGYLAGSSHLRYADSGADPKDKLSEFQLYENALAALYEGHRESAIATLSEILKWDSRNLLARRDLGNAYLEQERYQDARTNLEQFLVMAPEDYMAHFELAIADKHLGLLSAAKQQLEQACRIAPGSSQCKHELDAIKEK